MRKATHGPMAVSTDNRLWQGQYGMTIFLNNIAIERFVPTVFTRSDSTSQKQSEGISGISSKKNTTYRLQISTALLFLLQGFCVCVCANLHNLLNLASCKSCVLKKVGFFTGNNTDPPPITLSVFFLQ